MVAVMMTGAGDSKSPARAAAAGRRRDRRRTAPPHLQRLHQDRGADGHGVVACMKLLRNRREAQVRQMHSDITALLHEKREDTARISVSTQPQRFQFIYLQITRKEKRTKGKSVEFKFCKKRRGYQLMRNCLLWIRKKELTKIEGLGSIVGCQSI